MPNVAQFNSQQRRHNDYKMLFHAIDSVH